MRGAADTVTSYSAKRAEMAYLETKNQQKR